VSWSQLSCCIWCCSCHCHAAHGVTGAVVVAQLVLQLPSSHHTWCCGHCCCGTIGVAVAIIAPHMVSWALSSCCIGVGAAVVVPCIMLQALSSWCDWCCSCHCHTVHGVVGIVVAPHVVSWVLLSRCMGVGAAIVMPHMMLWALLLWHDWCHSCHCCTACGVVGIVVGLQKRKLVEKNKNKKYK